MLVDFMPSMSNNTLDSLNVIVYVWNNQRNVTLKGDMGMKLTQYNFIRGPNYISVLPL